MVAECQGTEKHRFAMPYCCDLRFCSFCAPRAYVRLLKKHSAVLEYVRKNPRPGYRLRLITLTSLNTGSLSKAVVDAFNRSTKKTLQRLMKGRKGWGALSVDEVGFNNLNLHAHILFYGPYITQDDLKRMWDKISGFQVVWIEEAEVDGQQALSYMLKYVSKPPSDNPSILAQLERAFHGARRAFAWGLFYNFKTPNEVEDCSDRSCPRCGAELSIIRLLRPMSELRAEGLPLLNAVRREKGHRGPCDLPYMREELLRERLGQIVKDIFIPGTVLAQLEDFLVNDRDRQELMLSEQRNRVRGRLNALRSRLDQSYVDKLDGKITEDLWTRKSDEWRAEEQRLCAEFVGLEQAKPGKFLDGIRILELAHKAHFLYLKQTPEEQAKLLKIVVSNCSIDAINVYPTYRKPFDLIFARSKNEGWRARRDSNSRPSSSKQAAVKSK
jgi:hypothetical protein